VRTISILFALVLISATAVYGDEFVLHGGTGQEEIAVSSGKEFRISIDGAGWYLNRYDRQRLKFRYRIVDPTKTSFVILPLQAGEGYLLFSYLKEDVYVRVVIDGEEAPGSAGGQAPAVTESGAMVSGDTVEPASSIPERDMPAPALAVTGEGEKPAGPTDSDREEESVRVFGDQENASAREKDEGVKEPGDLRKPKDTEGIYYIDEAGRVVSVPANAGMDEGDEYKRGTTLYGRKRYSEAAERFVRYLDRCEECEYEIDASMKLAESLVAIGREKEAIPYLDKVIGSKAAQYYKRAYVLRGNIYYKEGSLKKALQSYRDALDAGVESVEVLRRVGDLHYELNEYGSALEIYERLKNLGAADDSLFFRVATIYDSPGKPRDIEKAYSYYKLLVAEYGKSEYCPFARKRIDFLEKNFFDYK
jgi:tetratricopeptide (TPR) repeat protein